MLISRTRGEFLIVLIACLFGAQLFFSLALAVEKTPAKAITDVCNPGEVHTIKQAGKGSAPLPTKVACFAKSSAGTTAYTSSARSRLWRQHRKRDPRELRARHCSRTLKEQQ